MVDPSATIPLVHSTLQGVLLCMLLRYTKGDVVKTKRGLATVLSSNWTTVSDGWHPDKRRSEESVRVMTDDGSIVHFYGFEIEGPVIKGSEM